MIRRPPRSTLTDPLFPYTTLFRSSSTGANWWKTSGGASGLRAFSIGLRSRQNSEPDVSGMIVVPFEVRASRGAATYAVNVTGVTCVFHESDIRFAGPGHCDVRPLAPTCCTTHGC